MRGGLTDLGLPNETFTFHFFAFTGIVLELQATFTFGKSKHIESQGNRAFPLYSWIDARA